MCSTRALASCGCDGRTGPSINPIRTEDLPRDRSINEASRVNSSGLGLTRSVLPIATRYRRPKYLGQGEQIRTVNGLVMDSIVFTHAFRRFMEWRPLTNVGLALQSRNGGVSQIWRDLLRNVRRK